MELVKKLANIEGNWIKMQKFKNLLLLYIIILSEKFERDGKLLDRMELEELHLTLKRGLLEEQFKGLMTGINPSDHILTSYLKDIFNVKGFQDFVFQLIQPKSGSTNLEMINNAVGLLGDINSVDASLGELKSKMYPADPADPADPRTSQADILKPHLSSAARIKSFFQLIVEFKNLKIQDSNIFDDFLFKRIRPSKTTPPFDSFLNKKILSEIIGDIYQVNLSPQERITALSVLSDFSDSTDIPGKPPLFEFAILSSQLELLNSSLPKAVESFKPIDSDFLVSILPKLKSFDNFSKQKYECYLHTVLRRYDRNNVVFKNAALLMIDHRLEKMDNLSADLKEDIRSLFCTASKADLKTSNYLTSLSAKIKEVKYANDEAMRNEFIGALEDILRGLPQADSVNILKKRLQLNAT